MALEQENTNQHQPQPETAAKQRPTDGSWAFGQGLLKTPVAAGTGGEYLSRFRTQLTEIYKDIATGLKIDVISLNRQQITELRFSALVIAVRSLEDEAAGIVGYHILLLEATGERLKPRPENVDNMNLLVNRVTGDAIDNILFDKARDAVARTYPSSTIVYGSHEVVPDDIKVGGERPDDRVENIARNAALACYAVISDQASISPVLNLAKLDRSSRLEINMSFGHHKTEDILGRPQRASFLLTYDSITKNPNAAYGQADLVNTPENVTRISEIGGFINPIWAPVDTTAGFGYMQSNQPRAPQKFAAEMVVTSIRTNYSTSLPALLVGLSSIFTMVDNNTWMQYYLPTANNRGQGSRDGNIDLTDIGCLNYTGNLENNPSGFGAKIDMSEIRGDLVALNQYITTLFRSGLVVSIDCPEAGPDTWILADFQAAAAGDVDAYNRIYNAAQEVTNGNFERYFPHGTPMFSNIVRIPLGTYPGPNNTMEDIRNIDYTAVAAVFGPNDPARIHAYAQTFVNRPGVSDKRNRVEREAILADVLSHQLNIEGYAARVTAAAELITGLSRGMADCGLPVAVNTPLSADQLRIGTPVPGFINNSIANNTATFQNIRAGVAGGHVYRGGGIFR